MNVWLFVIAFLMVSLGGGVIGWTIRGIREKRKRDYTEFGDLVYRYIKGD